MREVSIRQSLIRNLLLIILLMGAGIAAVSFYGTRQLVATLSRTVIVRTLEFTEARLRGFFEPVPAALRTVRAWAEAGLLDEMDAGSLDRLLRPLVAEHSQIASARVADDTGREYLFTRREQGFAVRETRPQGGRSRLRWTEPGDAPGAWQDVAYDPRKQGWYRDAVDGVVEDRESVRWSEPYHVRAGVPGITASIAAQGRAGAKVIAIDIQLKSVSAFTSTVQAGRGGGVVVLSGDGRIIGAPTSTLRAHGIEPQEALLKTPQELGWVLAGDAARELAGDDAAALPTRFVSDGIAYWGQARSLPLAPARSLFIAVVVPEKGLLGPLPILGVYVMTIVLLVLLVAILQAVALARRFSRPVEALVAESDRISRGDLEDPGQIETSIAEVRRLADAHARMRTGLRSLMRLERDLKIARQIQQHTFPDRFPHLAGFDIDAFSEPAEQTGGDTYDVVARAPTGHPAASKIEGEEAAAALLLLADVTGHGIGPALSAVQVRAMLRMATRMDADLTTIARHVNAQLASDLFGGRFITAWLGELDASTHTLSYVSAGQAPLIYFHADRSEFEFLDADAPPFGIDADMHYQAGRPLDLSHGDIFAVFSDGVFDSRSDGGERFGEERILRIIRDNKGESCGRILLELRKALADFAAGTPAADDRTAVIIKRV